MVSRIESFFEKKTIKIIVCLSVCVLFGFYYYGIHKSFIPNGEDCIISWQYFMHLRSGNKGLLYNDYFGLSYYVAALVKGATFDAVRLGATFLVVPVFVVYLLLVTNKRQNISTLYLIPMIIFVSVLLPIISGNTGFGRQSEADDFIVFYPFDYHASSTFYSLLCTFLVGQAYKAKDKKHRIIYAVASVIATIVAVKHSDIIFFLLFLIPLVMYILFSKGSMIVMEGKRKKIYIAVGVFASILVVTRFIPTIRPLLWNTESTGIYGQGMGIYGGCNWISVSEVREQVWSYVQMMLRFFSIDAKGTTTISIYTAIHILRLLTLIVAYIIVIVILRDFITKRGKFDVEDYILTFAFVILSAAFLFTDVALNIGQTRYFTPLAWILWIITLRNVDLWLTPIVKYFGMDIKSGYLSLAIIFTLSSIASIKPLWKYDIKDSKWDEAELAINYIKENGVDYVLASYWEYARLTLQSGGEVIFYVDDKMLKEREGDDADYRYVVTVTSDNKPWYAVTNFDKDYDSTNIGLEQDLMSVIDFGK